MTNVNIKANDLEVLWVGPESDTDERVPTAQELAAANHLHQQNLERAQRIERPAGLQNRPTFSTTGKSVVIPAGMAPFAPGHPSLSALIDPVTVDLPALSDTSSSVSRYDRLYLMVFGGVVSAAVDPDINLSFEWRSQNNTLQILSKENTRRVRSFWAVVWSQGPTTAEAIYAALPSVGGKQTLNVAKSALGTALNATLRVYPLDPNLVDSKAYNVLSDTVELIDLCRVWRVQNYTQAGYQWGRGAEKDFEAQYQVQPTYRYVGDGWDDWGARSRETIRRIFLGLPLIESPTYDRAVSNLINGQVGTNLDAPGLATASPNGSTALSNGQRVSYSNQAITQKTYCLPVATINAAGFAQASVPFQTNSPAGAYFSQNASDHKVYSAIGRDITADGTLLGLGGTGALIWTANSNAVAAPGDVVFVAPAIYYPAGSGFSYTGVIEKVYLNGTTLNAANVREASVNNVEAYTDPAASENYIAVLGKERAALHYIYKKITVASGSGGTLVLPNSERGLIAFISGAGAPAGRIDKPVITGLTPSTNYSLLVYYPPAPTDNWQFQFRTARYAGTGEKAILNGAHIASTPAAFAHSQGGGNGVFLADGEYQYEAIAFRLPANSHPNAIKHYLCNYRMQFATEGDVGATSFREVWLNPAAGLALPKVGMKLATVDGVTAQGRGLAVTLQSYGRTLGVKKLPIQCGQIYQLVVACLVVKDGERRLLLTTLNEANPLLPSDCQFSSDSPGFAGIDTFRIY